MSITLYKIGGSLLDLPDLAQRMQQLLSLRAETVPLILVGGGPTADVVRRWDRIHQLGEQRAHWLAIHSLSLNEALLAELLPRCVRVRSKVELLEQSQSGRLPLLSVEDFLRADEQHADSLPHNWTVTSDSIAVHATIRFEADELVLVKSTPPPLSLRVAAAQTQDLVDAHFHQLADRLPQISWADLRTNESAKITPWLSHGQPILETETHTSPRR